MAHPTPSAHAARRCAPSTPRATSCATRSCRSRAGVHRAASARTAACARLAVRRDLGTLRPRRALEPGAVRIPWRQRFEQARLALCIAVGDNVTVEHDGLLALGRVEAFDSSVRVSRRTAWGGLPIELRRIGVEVRLPDGSTSTADAADVRAAGWHCPYVDVPARSGEPREPARAVSAARA
jgi:hypothetical protein